MAKNRAQKDLFASFGKDEVKDDFINKPEPVNEEPEPEPVRAQEPVRETAQTTATESVIETQQTVEDEPAEEDRKPGRPKNKTPKKYVYIDMTGIEKYVKQRAMDEDMFINEFLRQMVLKDAKEHMDVFKRCADMNNKRVREEIEKL